MVVIGEAIYKSKPRVFRYGMEAYAKMRGFKGKRALKEVERLKKLYPEAPLRIAPKAPYISRTQKSYWKDVKSLAEARGMNIKDTRKLLKGLKTGKNVQVRVIKRGEGWQFILFARYEHWDKKEMSEGKRDTKKKHEIKEETGYSYVHQNNDYYEEDFFDEAKRDAQAKLGGSGWQLIKVLKETWIRYYGREE